MCFKSKRGKEGKGGGGCHGNVPSDSTTPITITQLLFSFFYYKSRSVSGGRWGGGDGVLFISGVEVIYLSIYLSRHLFIYSSPSVSRNGSC